MPYNGDLQELMKAVDCQQARVFFNIDHMHLGEYSNTARRIEAADLARPDEGKRTPQ